MRSKDGRMRAELEGLVRSLEAHAADLLGHDERSSLWSAILTRSLLVAGHLDAGGRRYLVVRRCTDEDRGDALSPREIEVVDRISRGFSNKHIADELGLAVSTVATHYTRASRKLGIEVRALAHAARALGAELPK
ncbi:MAG: response regulator transcription factor [Deltaproteobacteria bacterium]|nr:response regulator transcription factor [Deltaproteobacteria bacterium]